MARELRPTIGPNVFLLQIHSQIGPEVENGCHPLQGPMNLHSMIPNCLENVQPLYSPTPSGIIEPLLEYVFVQNHLHACYVPGVILCGVTRKYVRVEGFFEVPTDMPPATKSWTICRAVGMDGVGDGSRREG